MVVYPPQGSARLEGARRQTTQRPPALARNHAVRIRRSDGSAGHPHRQAAPRPSGAKRIHHRTPQRRLLRVLERLQPGSNPHPAAPRSRRTYRKRAHRARSLIASTRFFLSLSPFEYMNMLYRFNIHMIDTTETREDSLFSLNEVPVLPSSRFPIGIWAVKSTPPVTRFGVFFET